MKIAHMTAGTTEPKPNSAPRELAVLHGSVIFPGHEPKIVG
jgi:hypothetical protein